eukprot:gene3917-7128_t
MKNKFLDAGAPDILRANQKDEYCLNHLEILLRDVGVYNQSKGYSELLYYFLTYGCNSMTLGEEYCDIQQVFKGINPSLILKIEYIFFRVIFPMLLDKGIFLFLKKTNENYRINMERIRNFIPYIFRFHLALFYIKGKYLEISKRSLNINYIFFGNQKNENKGNIYIFPLIELIFSGNYQLLGYLILFQQIISIFLYIQSLSDIKSLKFEYEEEKKSDKTCPHCLEIRRFTTSTPCGHLVRN